MRIRSVIAALFVVILPGCDPDDGELAPPHPPRRLTLPENVNRIDISAPDGHMLRRIDGSNHIAMVFAFLARHQTGWEYSNLGFPTAPLTAFFYRGDRCVGQIGAGNDGAGYFYTDMIEPRLCGIQASDADLQDFLIAIGMQGYSLQCK